MKTGLLTVTGVSEDRYDKNERLYKMIEFSNPTMLSVVDEDTGEIETVRVKAKRCSTNQYKVSYFNEREDFMYNCKIGDKTPGEIITQIVEPYKIDDKMVDTYSIVVFGDTSSKLHSFFAVSAFKSAGHPIRELLSQEEIDRRYLELAAEAKMEEHIDPDEAEPTPEKKKIVTFSAPNLVDPALEEEEDPTVKEKSLTF